VKTLYVYNLTYEKKRRKKKQLKHETTILYFLIITQTAGFLFSWSQRDLLV